MLDINNPLEINIIKQQNQNTPKKNLTSTKKIQVNQIQIPLKIK